MIAGKALQENDRAIELSQKGHIELALYARGLEIERDYLVDAIRNARDRLTSLAHDRGIQLGARKQVETVLEILTESLGVSPSSSGSRSL